MIMIDEEKKLTTISLLKTPKHERSSPLHGHTIANYETHTNSLSRGGTQEEKRDFYEFIYCVDKMSRERKIGKSRKEKEVRRLERKGRHLGTEEKRDLL